MRAHAPGAGGGNAKKAPRTVWRCFGVGGRNGAKAESDLSRRAPTGEHRGGKKTDKEACRRVCKKLFLLCKKATFSLHFPNGHATIRHYNSDRKGGYRRRLRSGLRALCEARTRARARALARIV